MRNKREARALPEDVTVEVGAVQGVGRTRLSLRGCYMFVLVAEAFDVFLCMLQEESRPNHLTTSVSSWFHFVQVHRHGCER